MYTPGVHPMKATGMLWIDQKIHAMGHVVENFGLCNQHLQNVISMTANAKARMILEEKYAKVANAKVLLSCAVFIDVLAKTKNFSLKTQKVDISITDVVEAVENTKQNY